MKHRIDVTENDLPEPYRIALHDMRAGRRRRETAPTKARIRTVSVALRGLIAAAREAGETEEICTRSVWAYVEALRARGSKDTAIAAMLGELRRFARYSGHGLDWAITETRKDFRGVADVLADRHWRPYRAKAEELYLKGTRLADLKLVDRWLRHRSRRVSAEDVKTFVGGSARNAHTLASLMFALEPDSPDQPLFDAERLRLTRVKVSEPRGDGSGRGRVATISVKPDDLPDEIRAVIQVMSVGRKAKRAPTIKGIEAIVRQLAFFARQAGYDDLLARPTLCAFFDKLDERQIGMKTRAGYVRRLANFARHAGVDANLIADLHDEARLYEEGAPPGSVRKLLKLAERPLSLVEVAAAGRRELLAADEAISSAQRRRCLMRAAAFALLCILIFRAEDVMNVVIDRDIKRTTTGWCIALELSKNSERAMRYFG